MNPEPAENLNLSPVIERNASIELSPEISEKEYDFFRYYISLYIRDRSRFFCASWAWNYTFIGNYTFFSIHIIVRPNLWTELIKLGHVFMKIRYSVEKSKFSNTFNKFGSYLT